MDLQKLFERDLEAITEEAGTFCTINGKNGIARILAVFSDASKVKGSYGFAEANTIGASCQFNGNNVPFNIVVGDIVTNEYGISYRVASIVTTAGDSSITLGLAVDGR